MTIEVYPVTIVPARYGGTYEPGEWLAFPLDPDRLPFGWDGDDVTCVDFWGEYHHTAVGAGGSPNDAYADLVRQVR